MKIVNVAALLCVCTLAACSDGPSSSPLTTSSYGGVTFHYPAAWGELVEPEQLQTVPPTHTLTFDALFAASNYPSIGSGGMIEIDVREYNDGEYRYDEHCGLMVLLCNHYGPTDILAQKSKHDGWANTTIAGYPAQTYEWYGGKGGAPLSRIYTFFTPTHRFNIKARYNVLEMYKDEHAARIAAGEDVLIWELLLEEVEEENTVENVYEKLVALHPEETQGMQTFFTDVTAMIASMRSAP